MRRIPLIQLSLASGHSDWPCEKEEIDLVYDLYTILSKFSRGKSQINHRVYRLVNWFGKHVKNSKRGEFEGLQQVPGFWWGAAHQHQVVLAGTSWHKLVQAGACWNELVPVGTSSCVLIPLGTSWY